MSDALITPDRSAGAPSNPRGRWRRWVLRVMLVLLLATTANLATIIFSWRFGASPAIGRWDERCESYDVGPPRWYWAIVEGLSVTLAGWRSTEHEAGSQSSGDERDVYARASIATWMLGHEQRASDLPRGARYLERAYGWPWRGLHARVRYRSSQDQPKPKETGLVQITPQSWIQVERGYLVEKPQTDVESLRCILPTHILWPGMLANTLVWSLIVMTPWVMWQGVWWVRRRMRARRGKCPYCRYDLRGLPAQTPCPECGRSVVK